MLMQYTVIFGRKISKISLDFFLYIFLILAQNIDCGSNEYPYTMFWNKNKQNRYTHALTQFSYIKVGFKGVYTFSDAFAVCSIDHNDMVLFYMTNH